MMGVDYDDSSSVDEAIDNHVWAGRCYLPRVNYFLKFSRAFYVVPGYVAPNMYSSYY